MILKLPEGHGTVRARKVGEVAIHPINNGEYAVSHIKSGRAAKYVCCEESALGLARALKGFDWSYTLPRKKLATVKFPKRVQKSMAEAAKVVASWKCPKGCR